MKYAGFKKGMKVIIKGFYLNGDWDEDTGIIIYSSGQRLRVQDSSGNVWDFTRHGNAYKPDHYEDMVLELCP